MENATFVKNDTVPVTVYQGQPWFVDMTGTARPMGSIIEQHYGSETDKHVRYSYVPNEAMQNKQQRAEAYSLGSGLNNASFMNPAATQQFLLDQGFTPAKQYWRAGGLEIINEYRMDDLRFADVFGFDLPVWRHDHGLNELVTVADKPIIFGAIRLVTDLRFGHMAARMTGGLYRLICTNGAYGELLPLGSLTIPHYGGKKDWRKEFNNAFEPLMKLMGKDIPRGEVIGNKRGLAGVLNLVWRIEADERFDIQNPDIQFFGELPKWMRKNLINMFALRVESETDGDKVYALDAFQMATSAVNIAVQNADAGSNDFRRIWRGTAYVKNIVKSLVGLLSAWAIADMMRDAVNLPAIPALVTAATIDAEDDVQDAEIID